LISDRIRDAHELATPDQENGVSCLTGQCHNQTWEYWNMTTHSGYLVELNETTGNITVNKHRETPYAVFNATCAMCHAINWDNSTYPNTHDGFGTNCLTCHDTSTPYYSVNGTVCATCHIGHSGTFVDDWTNSAHANSLTDLRTSSHAGSDCMHCMSVEGFLDQDAELDPAGDYNAITCPACHSVHSADIVNPAMIRAVNSTELCGLCHIEERHPSYTVWRGGAHDLTGIVECVDCHGFQKGSHGAEMNHSFYVNPDDACGQAPECHEGQEAWAISQLEEIQSSFDALVADFETEASAFETIIMTYNATAGADYELVNHVLGIVDDASTTVGYYVYDRSSGFHDPTETFDALNSAYRDLLDAKAYYYENLPAPAAGFSADTLIIVAGAAGGIIVGLLLGVLVGRRR